MKVYIISKSFSHDIIEAEVVSETEKTYTIKDARNVDGGRYVAYLPNRLRKSEYPQYRTKADALRVLLKKAEAHSSLKKQEFDEALTEEYKLRQLLAEEEEANDTKG